MVLACFLTISCEDACWRHALQRRKNELKSCGNAFHVVRGREFCAGAQAKKEGKKTRRKCKVMHGQIKSLFFTERSPNCMFNTTRFYVES